MPRNKSGGEDHRGSKNFLNLMPRGRRTSSSSSAPAAQQQQQQQRSSLRAPAVTNRSATVGNHHNGNALYPDINSLPMSIRDMAVSIQDFPHDGDGPTEFLAQHELTVPPSPSSSSSKSSPSRKKSNHNNQSPSKTPIPRSPSVQQHQPPQQPSTDHGVHQGHVRKQSLEPPGEKEDAPSHFDFVSDPTPRHHSIATTTSPSRPQQQHHHSLQQNPGTAQRKAHYVPPRTLPHHQSHTTPPPQQQQQVSHGQTATTAAAATHNTRRSLHRDGTRNSWIPPHVVSAESPDALGKTGDTDRTFLDDDVDNAKVNVAWVPPPVTESEAPVAQNNHTQPSAGLYGEKNRNNFGDDDGGDDVDNYAGPPAAQVTSASGHRTASGGLFGKRSNNAVSLQDDDPRANAAWDAVHAPSATNNNNKTVPTVANNNGEVLLGKQSHTSIPLSINDPRAKATWDAHHGHDHRQQTQEGTARQKLNEDDEEDDVTDEAMDVVPPITFQPSTVKRQTSLKKPPSTTTTQRTTPMEQHHHSVAHPPSTYQPPAPLPSAPAATQQAPRLDTIPSVGSSASSTTDGASAGSTPSVNTAEPVEPDDVVGTKRRKPASGKVAVNPPSSSSVPSATVQEEALSTETEEEKQLRIAKEESLKQAEQSENDAGDEPVPEDLLETAQENARTLLSICRQGGQEGHVDPSILEYYLNMCNADQKRISSSSIGHLDIDKVEKVLAVNDMLLTAIETGNKYKETWQKKKAVPKKNDSLAIASLVSKKDIFSLICMLRAQQDDQRLEAALALMNFARRAEKDDATEEDRRLRNEILSSGGLHSLLTLFRSKSSLFELKVVVALAVARILPSFVVSSSTLLKPGLGLKIMECLRFLNVARDVSPRGERIAKEESFQAAAVGLATFWVNQLEPMLRAQGGEFRTTGAADGYGRVYPTIGASDNYERLSLGTRRGRSTPGQVFDQRKEAIGTQELLEMTVSLIISFARVANTNMSGVEVDPVLLVEQICAVEVARPIAVREGVLKILVDWIDRGGDGRNRLAAAYSLRYLTSIKDKYMAGWIHSQMVNEGALPAIVRLTRDESLGPQVRLAIAQILSSLCVAPHTRAAVVEADCIHFLVDILFEHVTSQEVASYATQALLQLAAGAIMRASALGGDGVQSFATPDKRDKVVDDIVERGAIGSLVEIALQHKGKLRAVAVESLRVLSEDISPKRQTRLKLCDDGAARAIGNMLKDTLPSVENTLRNQQKADRDLMHHLHEGLCALSNLLDPLPGSLSSSRTRNTRQVSNSRDPNQMLVTACINVIESGGLDSLIRIALLPFNSSKTHGSRGISTVDLLAETCQSISSLSPLLLSTEVSAKRLSCWANDVLLTLDCVLNELSQHTEKDDDDPLTDIHVSALQGISALACASPLQIRIIDRSLPYLLEAKNAQDQRDISNAASQAFQSLDLAEDEVAQQVAGNSAGLLADWLCMQRSLLIQAMARQEIRDTVLRIWELPFRERSTGPTKLVREVSDRSKSDDDKSMGNYFFDNLVGDDIPTKKIVGILKQYDGMFGCESPSGDHRVILDEKISSSTSKPCGLLHTQIYPLGSTSTETDWLLRHNDYQKSDTKESTRLNDHVEKLLGVCFPSQLIRDHVIPMKSLRPDASFDFRALMMPQRRYFSFRREGQLLSRICGKDDEQENVHWTLGFTNSSFAGEFAESLVQALYLCPMVCGLSFTRNHQWYSVKQWQEEGETTSDDGVGLLANVVGSLPPWIANLTFDGLLGGKELRSLVGILDDMGKLSAGQQSQTSPIKEGLLQPVKQGEGQEQGRFWCVSIRNCPHISAEIWLQFYGLVGKVGRASRSSTPRPLSMLKALDLSGNGLNDDLCASLLELVLDKDSGCMIEQIDLSRNRLANATETLNVLRNYVQTHRAGHLTGVKPRSRGWKTPLHTLLLSSTGLQLGGAWLELVTLLKNNALPLKSLDLSANKIILKGNSYETETFLSCILKNTSLVHLDLSENRLSSDTIDTLISRLGRTTVDMGLSFVDLSHNEPPLTDRQESILNNLCLRSRSNLVERMFSEREESSKLSMLGTSELSISYASEPSQGPSGYNQDAESSFGPLYPSSGADHSGKALSAPGDNMITVLFSAPLVYKDGHGSLRPFAKLDFDMERDLILQCLKEASRDIDLRFDTATHHQLLSAITNGCSCLHYSGHGHQKFLPFEDGSGGPHWFEVHNIKSLIAGRKGGAPFRFVFVSACHSGLAGETFASAGVPHVVCCKQEFELKDTAALAFTRQFYLALAVGHTVKESFEQGRKAVRATPNLRDAESEYEKFVLLPRDGNHDVPIFNAKQMIQWPHASSYRKKKSRSKADLSIFNKMQEAPSTSPPQFFLGREVDMYMVLNLVLEKRLVSIVGEAGVGRSSLACALCHYMNERASTITQINHIFYIKARQSRKQSRARALVQKLIKKLVDAQKIEPDDAETGPDVDIESLFDVICHSLRDSKCLIVFDRTELLKDSDETREFPMLLSNLFRETRHVRVLLTGREPLGIPSIGGQVEHHFCLGPLTYANTVRLFSCLCPYIHTPAERRRLFSVVVTDLDEADLLSSDPGLSINTRKIFSLLGNGMPARVEKAAYVMTKDDVLTLMNGSDVSNIVGADD